MTEARRAGRTAVVRIGLSTAVSTAATLAVLLFAARVLGARGYAEFMVLWGTFFVISGLWQGLQQEVTRSLSAVRSGRPATASLVGATVLVGFSGAVVFLVLGLALGTGWLGLDRSVIVVLAAGAFVYALANGYNGALASAGEWGLYAWAILGEAAFRSTFLILALEFWDGPPALALALVGGFLVWVLLSASRRARRTLAEPGDSRLPGFAARVAQASAATACSVLVIAGFPVLLDVTTSGPLSAEAGILMAAVVVTRAPILLTASALQGVLITKLVAAGHQADTLLRRWLAFLFVGLVAMCLGSYLVGPELMGALFGDDFETTVGLLVGLSLAAAAVAALTLTGWATLAAGRHGPYLWGWLTALIGTVLLLLLPLSLEARSVLALTAGPTLGGVVHVSALFLGRS